MSTYNDINTSNHNSLYSGSTESKVSFILLVDLGQLCLKMLS